MMGLDDLRARRNQGRFMVLGAAVYQGSPHNGSKAVGICRDDVVDAVMVEFLQTARRGKRVTSTV